MTRAQLIEFTADRRCSVAERLRRRTSPSPGPGSRRRCRRSPRCRRSATSTVVIWRRCTSDTRPRGCRITMSIASRSRHASMAAEPVSPEVAPTMVTRVAAARELVVEQPADELQRDVLERQRGPVEQLEQPRCRRPGRHERRHVGVGERRGYRVRRRRWPSKVVARRWCPRRTATSPRRRRRRTGVPTGARLSPAPSQRRPGSGT